MNQHKSADKNLKECLKMNQHSATKNFLDAPHRVVYAIVVDRDVFIPGEKLMDIESSIYNGSMKKVRILIGDVVYEDLNTVMEAKDKIGIRDTYIVTLRVYGEGCTGFIGLTEVELIVPSTKEEDMSGVIDEHIPSYDKFENKIKGFSSTRTRIKTPVVAIDKALNDNMYHSTNNFISSKKEHLEMFTSYSDFLEVTIQQRPGSTYFFGYVFTLVNHRIIEFCASDRILYATQHEPVRLDYELCPCFRTEEAAKIFMKDRGLWFCVPHLIRFIDV